MSFGHMMREANRALQARLGSTLMSSGVTVAQWYVLRVLWDEDGLSQSTVAARAGISNPSVGAAFQTLMRAGLIQRLPDTIDRRKNIVSLTEAGRRMEEVCIQKAIETNQAALVGIDPADAEAVLRVLHRVKANLAQDVEMSATMDDEVVPRARLMVRS